MPDGSLDRVSAAGYQHVLQFTMFTVQVLNALRKTVLSVLTNRDLRRAKDIYQSEEGGQLVPDGGVFVGKVVEMLPTSDACKTGNPVMIFFNTFCLELFGMLRDMASWYFVGQRFKMVSKIQQVKHINTNCCS